MPPVCMAQQHSRFTWPEQLGDSADRFGECIYAMNFKVHISTIKGVIIANEMRDRILVGDKLHRMSCMQACLGAKNAAMSTAGGEGLLQKEVL
jgi:hypothetical protein